MLLLLGLYKRTQTAALRQAKFYLPRQAAVPQRLVYCGDIYSCYGRSRQAAVDKSLFSPLSTAACLLRPQQLYIYIAVTVDKLQLTRDSFSPSSTSAPRLLQRLVYCSASKVGVKVPQFESFYTVPLLLRFFTRRCQHVTT